MSNVPCPSLSVATEGTRSFINVPSPFAAALHHFLRANWVTSSPPEPLSSGTDCIQLGKGSDSTSVQRVLDKWTKALTPSPKRSRRSRKPA